MSLLGKLFGQAPSPKGPPQPADAVRAALLAVNRPTAPFQVRQGNAGEADLVAEWRIVDAGWYEIFAKAQLEKAFKVLMRLTRRRMRCAASIRNGRSNGAPAFRR